MQSPVSSMNSPNKFALTALYLIYLSDLLAWSVVLVIFAPLLVSKTSSLLPHTPLEQRNVLLGLLLGIYPLTQLVAAPILGEISDQYGRKKILVLTTLGSSISLALTAIALMTQGMWLLFFSRFLAGACAGNITLSQAGVADLTTSQNRGRYMAFFAIASGLAWILGPFIGSELSNNNLVAWFDYATPFWLVFILFTICFFLILLHFKETLQVSPNPQFKLSRALGNLFVVFKVREILWPFSVLGGVYFGWFLFMSFFSADLIEKYGLGKQQIGALFIYASFWYFMGGLICNRWLLKKYSAESTIILPLIILALSIFVFTFLNRVADFWWVLFFASFSCAIVTTCLFTINSKMVPKDMQGRIFGSINAVFAFCFATTPPLAGWLENIWMGLPDFIGGLFLMSATGVYIYWYFNILTKNKIS